MVFRPHAYQAHCIRRILEVKKVGLFLDMGLGKTVTTLTAIRELKYNRFQVRKVLIIAPKKVAEGTWSREKDKWEHTKILRVSKVLGSQAKRVRALNTPADLYTTSRSICPPTLARALNLLALWLLKLLDSSMTTMSKGQLFR